MGRASKTQSLEQPCDSQQQEQKKIGPDEILKCRQITTTTATTTIWDHSSLLTAESALNSE